MHLAIQPLGETDIEQLVDVYNAAFSSSSPIHRNMYPNGATDVARRDASESFKKMLQEPMCSCFTLVDTDSKDRIVAWINWKTYKIPQPESEWNKPFEMPESETSQRHPDINPEFAATFFGALAKLKRDYLKGKARVHVGLLVTHPDYQRRGCGKKLLDKCAEQADQLSLPTILEASPVGAPLYIREGFIPIEGAIAQLEVEDHGRNITHTTVMMERPAGGVQK